MEAEPIDGNHIECEPPDLPDTYIVHSHGETETIAAGARLGGNLRGRCVIALYGGLGMGKTAFVRGLSQGLGFTGEVSSPTFAIVHEYLGGRLPLYHFDMYRIAGWDDLYTTGWFEALDKEAVVAAEWSEQIEAALPEDVIRVSLQPGNTPDERTIKIIGPIS